MGDKEAATLHSTGHLPDTQPYQGIHEGETGRKYSEKYLKGHKWVDTSPTTVIEFTLPREAVERLKRLPKGLKIEDGCLSMGLGFKAGGGLSIFNSSLRSFRVVMVKRRIVSKRGTGAGKGSARMVGGKSESKGCYTKKGAQKVKNQKKKR